jgi:hypothetical protein
MPAHHLLGHGANHRFKFLGHGVPGGCVRADFKLVGIRLLLLWVCRRTADRCIFSRSSRALYTWKPD